MDRVIQGKGFLGLCQLVLFYLLRSNTLILHLAPNHRCNFVLVGSLDILKDLGRRLVRSKVSCNQQFPVSRLLFVVLAIESGLLLELSAKETVFILSGCLPQLCVFV